MKTISSTSYLAKMEKLKDRVLRHANSDPNNPLSPSQIAHIQHQLTLAFPSFHSPTHPTYPAMILEAIKELNEGYGSKEELISEYIREKYQGLPWAHNMYLNHHLSKLCENGEIMCNSTSKCYIMPAYARPQEDELRKKGRKRRLLRKSKEIGIKDEEENLGGGYVIGFQEKGMEEFERNEDEEENVSGGFGVEANGFQDEDIEESGSRTKPRRRSFIIIEECDEDERTKVDEGQQNVGVARPNEKMAQKDGEGDFAQFMCVPAECVEEAAITFISSSVTNIGGENDYELAVKEFSQEENTIPAQAGIQEGNLRKEQLKERIDRKRKQLMNEDDEGDLGGEKVVKVSENLTAFKEENIEGCGGSRAKQGGRNLFVTEDNVEVCITAVDGEEWNMVVKGCNEVSGLGDISDADKMMLVPAECVEESPVTLVSSSVANIRCDNVPKLAANESGMRESELKIVLYKGHTSICEESAEINPISDTKDNMIICGLPCAVAQNPVRKYFRTKRLKACRKKKGQRILKVLLETMPSLPVLAVDHNLLEQDQLQELLLPRAIEPKLSEMGPIWLERMLKEQYFFPCFVHAGSSWNSCNRFCLDCMGDAICHNCLSHHKDHRVVQIRNYSCHKVVKTHDMQQYLDISDILKHNIECGEIVFFDFGPRPKFSKSATCCEICSVGRIDSFKFCSLPCKLIAARLQSTKFLPIDQSRHRLSLLECTSTEQMDDQRIFEPSQLSSLEDPMSVKDEENIPFKMFGKHGKRKKQSEQKFIVSTPLATEASNSVGSKSTLDLPNLECSKHQMEDKERQGQTDVRFGDIEAPITAFVEGDVPTFYQKCEQEPNQSEATKDDAVGIFNSHLQLPKGLDKPVTDLDSQKQIKQVMDDQGKTRENIETGKDDIAGPSNLSDPEQGLFESATNQHTQQQINAEEDTRSRPLLEEANNDAITTSVLHHQQQAGSSEPEIVMQVSMQIKRGRGRPRKYEKRSKEGQESEETNKKPRKVGRGRPRKQQDVSKEDSAAPLESAHKLEDTEHIMNFCPDKSPSEAHETLERGQAMVSSDDDIHRRKKQNLDGGDQADKQQDELNCHRIQVKRGKSEVVSHPKEKSRKSTAIQVPLSSKNQLRSRVKHQSYSRT